MKTQTDGLKITSSAHERLQEIGKILANGIYRLEAFERSQNPQILLDNKLPSSLHRIDSNLNQQAML